MDHSTAEVNSDAVTSDSNARDPSHDKEEDYNTTLKLNPDSDVEDLSSPEITHFEDGNLMKTKVSKNQIGDDNNEPMDLSDDEGTEENPITLSDSESVEDSTNLDGTQILLDEGTDGHSESQAIPIDHSPSPGNVDETQRIGDEDESQRTTGSSDDSQSVPFDLKPSQSPKSILSSVPNIGSRHQNSETDEDRESPSLLQSGTSQTWEDTADDRESPSLLQPRSSQSVPDDVLVDAAEKIEKSYRKNYFETVEATENRKKSGMKDKPSGESRKPLSDEHSNSPIITGSSGLPHSKQGGSKHFKEASKTDETNLESLLLIQHLTGRGKESSIDSINSTFSGSHSTRNYDAATPSMSNLIPSEGSLTDDVLLRSVEQFEANRLKSVDHQEKVSSSLQEVKSKKNDTNVEGQGWYLCDYISIFSSLKILI